jgi:hypothetical protein
MPAGLQVRLLELPEVLLRLVLEAPPDGPRASGAESGVRLA